MSEDMRIALYKGMMRKPLNQQERDMLAKFCDEREHSQNIGMLMISLLFVIGLLAVWAVVANI